MVFISSFIYHKNWYEPLMKNSLLTALIFKPARAKNRNLEARRNFESDLDQDSYPKDEHHQNSRGITANKPNRFKLSKCLSQKSNQNV